MDKFHNNYKKSLMAEFNSSYERDIEHGKELDRDQGRDQEKEKEENNMSKYPQAKLSPEQIKEIIDHPEIKASVFASKYGVTKQGIYYQRKKAKKDLTTNKSEQENQHREPPPPPPPPPPTRIIKEDLRFFKRKKDQPEKEKKEETQDIASQPGEPFREAMLELISMESSLIEFAAKLGLKIKVSIRIN